jgi:hypothetical protein
VIKIVIECFILVKAFTYWVELRSSLYQSKKIYRWHLLVGWRIETKNCFSTFFGFFFPCCLNLPRFQLFLVQQQHSANANQSSNSTLSCQSKKNNKNLEKIKESRLNITVVKSTQWKAFEFYWLMMTSVFDLSMFISFILMMTQQTCTVIANKWYKSKTSWRIIFSMKAFSDFFLINVNNRSKSSNFVTAFDKWWKKRMMEYGRTRSKSKKCKWVLKKKNFWRFSMWNENKVYNLF